MTNHRTLLKQLSHASDRLTQADEAMSEKQYALADIHIRASYNLIVEALEKTKDGKRNGDKGVKMLKRKILKEHFKTIRDLLKYITIDIKHDNKKSAYNGIKIVRKALKEIEGKENGSFRKGDNDKKRT